MRKGTGLARPSAVAHRSLEAAAPATTAPAAGEKPKRVPQDGATLALGSSVTATPFGLPAASAATPLGQSSTSAASQIGLPTAGLSSGTGRHSVRLASSGTASAFGQNSAASVAPTLSAAAPAMPTAPAAGSKADGAIQERLVGALQLRTPRDGNIFFSTTRRISLKLEDTHVTHIEAATPHKPKLQEKEKRVTVDEFDIGAGIEARASNSEICEAQTLLEATKKELYDLLEELQEESEAQNLLLRAKLQCNIDAQVKHIHKISARFIASYDIVLHPSFEHEQMMKRRSKGSQSFVKAAFARISHAQHLKLVTKLLKSQGRRPIIVKMMIPSPAFVFFLVALAAGPSSQAPIVLRPTYRDAPSQGRAPGYQASGRHGAVATEVDVCSNVGVTILQEGGNAVDSAIAATLCVGSIAAFHSGLGGGGFGLIKTARDGIQMFDFRETAPGASTQDMFVSNTTSSTSGGLAVAVPGEMKAWQEVHAKYGHLPFARLFRPAIELNRNGFKVPNQLGVALNPKAYPFLCKDPLFAESYCPNGIIKKEGDIVKKERYAATLQKMSLSGADAFYKGKIAQNTVAAINATGGIMTLKDLEAYRVVWRRPKNITFQGNHKVYASVAPSSGSVVLSTLQTLDQFSGLNPAANLTVHRMVEAMKFAYGERTNYADPAFITNVTALQAQYLRDSYAKIKARKIRDDAVGAGTYYNPANLTVLEDAGTSHISVVDKHGMAVTLTTSINTFWGSGVMTADGIILDNTMDDFSNAKPNVYGYVPVSPNFVRPGKRPLSSMSPVIVEDLATGALQLATGSAGGSRIITAVIQNVFNVLASNGSVNLQQSIARARLHDQLMPNTTALEWGTSSIPGFAGYSNSTAAYLASVGHSVIWVAPGSSTAQGVQRFANGTLLAAREVRQLSAGGAAY
ncbi:hypothetical protein HDU86_000870 [Geranomyces michiganensis]|nr:hypothetical protein HDU86_000870 [Geranomyces michiganensis]